MPKKKDAVALEIFERVGFRSAQGLGNLINILNPDVIALGTIPTHCGDYFFKPLKKYLPQFAWPRPLQAALFADNCQSRGRRLRSKWKGKEADR